MHLTSELAPSLSNNNEHKRKSDGGFFLSHLDISKSKKEKIYQTASPRVLAGAVGMASSETKVVDLSNVFSLRNLPRPSAHAHRCPKRVPFGWGWSFGDDGIMSIRGTKALCPERVNTPLAGIHEEKIACVVSKACCRSGVVKLREGHVLTCIR
jgi:hypothetical protein